MNERLEKYFDSLFESAPNTQEIHELREEIFSNTLEKYNDLISQGKSEEASFTQAVSGIGDLDSLLGMSCFRANDTHNYYTCEELKRNRLKCNIIISVSIMMFILSIVPPFVLEEALPNFGISLLFVFIAAAVFLITFGNKMRINPVKFSRQIELLKDTRGEKFTKEDFEKERITHSVMLSSGICLYILSIALCILIASIDGSESFAAAGFFILIALGTGLLVFYNCVKIDIRPTEPATVVENFKQWRNVNEYSKAMLRTVDAVIFAAAVIFYVLISIFTGAWYITWLVFVIAALVYCLVKVLFKFSQMSNTK